MVLLENSKEKEGIPRFLICGILMHCTGSFRYSFYNSLKKLGRPLKNYLRQIGIRYLWGGAI